MFRSLGKELIRFGRSWRAPSTSTTATSWNQQQGHFLQTQPFKSHRWITYKDLPFDSDLLMIHKIERENIGESPREEEQYMTIDRAVSSILNYLDSKKIIMDDSEKMDFILEMFSKQRIPYLLKDDYIKERPSLVLKNPSFESSLETLIIEYFENLGFSASEIKKLLPKIIRSYNFFRSFIDSDKKFRSFIKKSFHVLDGDMETEVGQRMSILRDFGVPDTQISKLLLIDPDVLLYEEMFRSFYRDVIFAKHKLGFDPSSNWYIYAVKEIMHGKFLWIMNHMESYGLSKDEVYAALKSEPQYLLCSCSRKKIEEMMDFMVNKLNCNASVFLQHPGLIVGNLKKRLIPRCSVLQLLMAKGLLKKDINILQTLKLTEKKFIERFVAQYQEMVPEVVNVHQGMIEFKGFTESVNVSITTSRKKKTPSS